MNKRLMAATMGVYLLLGGRATALRKGPDEILQAEKRAASIFRNSMPVIERTSKDGKVSCRLDGEGLHVRKNGNRMVTIVPEHIGVPLDLFCSDGMLGVLHTGGILRYDKEGMAEQPIKGSTRFLKGIFVRDGKEIIAITSDGFVSYTRWDRFGMWNRMAINGIKVQGTMDQLMDSTITAIDDGLYIVKFRYQDMAVVYSQHCTTEILEPKYFMLQPDSKITCQLGSCSITDGSVARDANYIFGPVTMTIPTCTAP